jgi:hypothetical protein
MCNGFTQKFARLYQWLWAVSKVIMAGPISSLLFMILLPAGGTFFNSRDFQLTGVFEFSPILQEVVRRDHQILESYS